VLFAPVRCAPSKSSAIGNSYILQAGKLAVRPVSNRSSGSQWVIREVREKETPLNDLIASYTNAFMLMTSQTAACNRLHSVDQRLCRWILLVHARAQRDEFVFTQEFMAQMLGVHRPTVSTTANMLLQAGLISYSRGNLKILDRAGLLAGSCECYRIMEAQFDKIFDQPWIKLAREQNSRADSTGG